MEFFAATVTTGEKNNLFREWLTNAFNYGIGKQSTHQRPERGYGIDELQEHRHDRKSAPRLQGESKNQTGSDFQFALGQ
ncbi:MAG: hypothetical protein U1E74_04055 [Paenacidovorax caeni]